jgi:hypothetical protein
VPYCIYAGLFDKNNYWLYTGDMNEYVYVEFLFDMPDSLIGSVELRKLGDDFQLIDTSEEFDHGGAYHTGQRYCGKISAEAATMIKLSNPFLAEHMHISYISTQLKDKYRTDK